LSPSITEALELKLAKVKDWEERQQQMKSMHPHL
jgi:hypothetical protein